MFVNKITEQQDGEGKVELEVATASKFSFMLPPLYEIAELFFN
jgi:hypothetical protein